MSALSFTKDRRMWFLACVILALVAIAEGAYIWQHRHHAPGRFKAVNEWSGWDNAPLAFDTATGQLCRTIGRTIRVRQRPSPAASNAPESQPSKSGDDQRAKGDPILDAIRGRYDAEAAEKAAAEAASEKAEWVEFFRGLPACRDIR